MTTYNLNSKCLKQYQYFEYGGRELPSLMIWGILFKTAISFPSHISLYFGKEMSQRQTAEHVRWEHLHALSPWLVGFYYRMHMVNSERLSTQFSKGNHNAYTPNQCPVYSYCFESVRSRRDIWVISIDYDAILWLSFKIIACSILCLFSFQYTFCYTWSYHPQQ